MSLIVENAGFSYPGCAPVLRDASLTVDPGERVALTAPSGSGKTTLCRLIAGYLSLNEGRIEVDGTEASRAGERPYRSWRGPRPVQLIWQHPEQAFDPRLTLARSLAEGAAGAEDARSAIEASGLLGRLSVRDAWLDRLPHELSGGELMRLAIVRALLARPRYLICDEMTAMLDAITQAQIWHEVMAIARERSMGLIVVSHSPALLKRVATRAIPLIH